MVDPLIRLRQDILGRRYRSDPDYYMRAVPCQPIRHQISKVPAGIRHEPQSACHHRCACAHQSATLSVPATDKGARDVEACTDLRSGCTERYGCHCRPCRGSRARGHHRMVRRACSIEKRNAYRLTAPGYIDASPHYEYVDTGSAALGPRVFTSLAATALQFEHEITSIRLDPNFAKVRVWGEDRAPLRGITEARPPRISGLARLVSVLGLPAS